MKELNYQYKIIEEKSINGKNILKVKDDIYDKIIFMEIYKKVSSDDWDESNTAEQEIGKLKESDVISDYFVNDDYSNNLKTFYKIYENYDGYESIDSSQTASTEKKAEKEEGEFKNMEFGKGANESVFNNSEDNYKLGDLTDSIGSGYNEGYSDSAQFNSISNSSEQSFEETPIDLEREELNSPTKYQEKEKVNIVKKKRNTSKKSEVKLNSYTHKSNQQELERIKRMAKKTVKTNYNSYSNSGYSVSKEETKKSKGGGFIFFLIVVSLVGVTFFISKKNRIEHSYKSKTYNENNYEKGASYYKKKQYYSAKRYFKTSCNYDKDKRGCSMMGFLYEENKIYSKNKYVIANDYYIKGCVLNDGYSCNRAGFLNRKELKNYKDSEKYYRMGCELNNDSACTDGGYVSEVKLGDIKKAKAFYEKGCELNNKTACNNLALIYHYDKIKGIKDIKKAKELYAKACKLGNKKSCDIKFGESKIKDINKISGTADELFRLAWKYQDRKEYDSANLLFSKACTKGNVSACNNIGYNYQKGFGFSKSNSMAKKYFIKGCDKKSGYACNKIGYFYKKGIEFKKDLKQSRKFFKKSCNLKYGLGCDNLAEIYELGNGVKKDPKIAKILYRKACKLGYKESCKK